MFSLPTAQIKICNNATYGGYVTQTGKGEGKSLIKVATDSWALGFSGVKCCPGIGFSWEVSFAGYF